MEKLRVKIKKLVENAVVPTYAHLSDAGMDLVATSRVFDEKGCATYGTGLAFEIPEGYVGLIFPRSSNCKKDLLQSNSVSVIDSGYRGEVYVKFKPSLLFVDKAPLGIGDSEYDYDGTCQTDINTQEVTFHGRNKNYPDVSEGYLPYTPRVYEIGERIGQIIIIPYPHIEFEEVDELSPSDRGEGGFGSTGK